MAAHRDREPLPVQAARTEDPEAWNTLFRRYQLPLYADVFECAHVEQAGLDIVQETFIRAVRHIGRLRDDAKFGSWVFGIAHQPCVQCWRKRRWEETPVEDHLESLAGDDASPRDWLIRQEEEEQFMDNLNQLSPSHRAVLLLHFLEEFSLEEIARIAGISVGTVKSRRVLEEQHRLRAELLDQTSKSLDAHPVYPGPRSEQSNPQQTISI